MSGTAIPVTFGGDTSIPVEFAEVYYVGGGGGGNVTIDETLSVAGQAADAKAVGDALLTKLDIKQDVVNAGKVLLVDENGNIVFEEFPDDHPVTYVESPDADGNYRTLRDLESGCYIVYGYWKPFPGSSHMLTFGGAYVSVAKKDAGSHVMVLSPLNFVINCLEILVDDTVEAGFTYTRNNVKLLNLHELIEQVGDLDDLTTSDKTSIVAAINEVVASQSSGGNVDQNGLTEAQISALDGMFKVCAYTEDASTAYAAFKEAFGIESEHTHSYTSTVTTVATCTTAGVKTYTCECGDTYTEEIPATGHSWDDGVVTVEPTEDTEGVRTYTCTICGETKTETIPTLDHEHSYVATVVAPTCTEQGYTEYVCACGDTYKDNYVDATGHNYEDGVCTECGEADPDYEEEVTLTSISATYSGGEVNAGTALTDLTGIVVTATYSDGSTETVTDYTLSGEIAEGDNTITASYGGMTTTFTVTGTVESGGEEQTETVSFTAVYPGFVSGTEQAGSIYYGAVGTSGTNTSKKRATLSPLAHKIRTLPATISVDLPTGFYAGLCSFNVPDPDIDYTITEGVSTYFDGTRCEDPGWMLSGSVEYTFTTGNANAFTMNIKRSDNANMTEEDIATLQAGIVITITYSEV